MVYFSKLGRTQRITPTETILFTYYHNTLIQESITEYSGSVTTGNIIRKTYFPGPRGESGIRENAFSENDDTVGVYQSFQKKVGSTTTTTNSFFFFDRDNLGSIDRITTITGATLTYYRYLPFL